jgi:hypothetical protein
MEAPGHGISMLFGAPALTAVVAGVLAVVLVYLAGWQTGLQSPPLRSHLLGCSLIGILPPSEQNHHRHEILHSMMENPGDGYELMVDAPRRATSASPAWGRVAGRKASPGGRPRRHCQDRWQDRVWVPMKTPVNALAGGASKGVRAWRQGRGTVLVDHWRQCRCAVSAGSVAARCGNDAKQQTFLLRTHS